MTVMTLGQTIWRGGGRGGLRAHGLEVLLSGRNLYEKARCYQAQKAQKSPIA